MEKKLPSIFANKIEKNIKNNECVYYSCNNKDKIEKEEIRNKGTVKLESNLNINQKINKIFSSTKYVYKADVRIYLKNENVDCRIIGKNSTHLITMDNKLIPLNDIVDIEFINN